MNMLKFLRGLKDTRSKIKETEVKIKNGELSMNWKDVYAQHKAKIWSIIWVFLTYVATPYVNDAVNNLPALKEVKDKVVIIESDIATIKKDLEEIKMVLTPPSN